MNFAVERMENIPAMQVFQERHFIESVPIKSQTSSNDDQPRTYSKVKIEELDNTQTQKLPAIAQHVSMNEDGSSSKQNSQNSFALDTHSLHSEEVPKVPLLTKCLSEQICLQKQLPSCSQTSPGVSRPSKISINDLLNNDSSDNNMESFHIPNVLSMVQRKRNAEQAGSPEVKRLKDTSSQATAPPVEAQLVSVPPAVAPPPSVAYMSYVPYPIPYLQPVQVVQVPQPVVAQSPSDALLAMATAASELSDSPSSNAGSPGEPTSPIAPGPIQELYDELWMKHFNQLKDFKSQFGHCNVTRTKAEWKSLGNWVAEQRRKMRQGKLSQQQYDMLSAQGFEWDRSYFFKAAVPVQAMYAEAVEAPPQNAPRRKNQKRVEE